MCGFWTLYRQAWPSVTASTRRPYAMPLYLPPPPEIMCPCCRGWMRFRPNSRPAARLAGKVGHYLCESKRCGQRVRVTRADGSDSCLPEFCEGSHKQRSTAPTADTVARRLALIRSYRDAQERISRQAAHLRGARPHDAPTDDALDWQRPVYHIEGAELVGD